MTDQSKEGAENYRLTSSKIQQHYFDMLINTIDIQPGWKVLDLGCGTGNGTKKLCERVGASGHVIGIDPIAERIVQAKEYYAAGNIKYHTAYGRDACTFGEGIFDLVVAGTVMHWLSPEEKQKTLESVYKALKPGGIFLFNNMLKYDSANTLKFLDFFKDQSVKEKLFAAVFCPDKRTFYDLAQKTGFSRTTIDEVSVQVPFDSLEHAIHWFSASLHAIGFHTALDELRQVTSDENNNLDFLFNEKGEPYFDNKYHFVTSHK
ncbi:ubiquinone/menaquinone biosynthesis C-methyltransferase UbiE-like [Clytia hemisphaerica]